jgi:hypothetical protein
VTRPKRARSTWWTLSGRRGLRGATDPASRDEAPLRAGRKNRPLVGRKQKDRPRTIAHACSERPAFARNPRLRTRRRKRSSSNEGGARVTPRGLSLPDSTGTRSVTTGLRSHPQCCVFVEGGVSDGGRDLPDLLRRESQAEIAAHYCFAPIISKIVASSLSFRLSLSALSGAEVGLVSSSAAGAKQGHRAEFVGWATPT